MEEKECKSCKKIKPLEMYHKKIGGIGGKKAICKQCCSIKNQENKELNKKYFKDWYEKNKKDKNRVSREYHQNNKNDDNYIQHRKEYRSQYYLENKEMFYERMIRRRVQIKEQPITIKSSNQLKYILKLQKGKCFLTGDSEDLQLEHFIPISIGHAGHTFRNCYYLAKTLNLSKNNLNPFEWILGQPKEIQDNFYNILVPTLAKRNRMAVEKYKQYVYWCFKHPQEFYNQIKLEL